MLFRTCKHHRIRLQRPQAPADVVESLLPGDFLVFVGGGVPAHGRGQAANFFQVVIAPLQEIGTDMRGEELRCHRLAGYIPCGGLGAVLAKLQRVRMRRLGPRTAEAHIPIGLVLMSKQRRTMQEHMLPGQAADHGLC